MAVNLGQEKTIRSSKEKTANMVSEPHVNADVQNLVNNRPDVRADVANNVDNVQDVNSDDSNSADNGLVVNGNVTNNIDSGTDIIADDPNTLDNEPNVVEERKKYAQQSCRENGYKEDQINRAHQSYYEEHGNHRYSGEDLAKIMMKEEEEKNDDIQSPGDITEQATAAEGKSYSIKATITDLGHPSDEATPHTFEVKLPLIGCKCDRNNCQPEIKCTTTDE